MFTNFHFNILHSALGVRHYPPRPTYRRQARAKSVKSKPQRHIEKILCVYVVFYFRRHGNYLNNSFAAYLLCEKKRSKRPTCRRQAGRQARTKTVKSKPPRHIEKSLCVVFYFKRHGNYLINSFSAYLLCENRKMKIGITICLFR